MQTTTLTAVPRLSQAIARQHPPVHQASDLTNGGILAHIQLADQLYTLRITRAGKLILTK